MILKYLISGTARRSLFCMILPFTLTLVTSTATMAQTGSTGDDAAYRKTIQLRASKIVQQLAVADTVKAGKVRDVIAAQYIALNDIYKSRDSKIAAVRNDKSLNKEVVNDSLKMFQAEAVTAVEKLHHPYLKKLAKLLHKDQVIKVKDGMTYGVVPLTYGAYLDMLPQLTVAQKEQIMVWLTEAREKAMDAESSEKKHGWFGKYKGKINNYLSAAGIDMKKEGDAWQERIKARSAHN